jgi:hypothetical protein
MRHGLADPNLLLSDLAAALYPVVFAQRAGITPDAWRPRRATS